jgi:2-alkenal reductase
VVLLGVVVSIAGGALAGGAAGYYLAQRSIAEWSAANEQVVVQTANPVIDEADERVLPAAPVAPSDTQAPLSTSADGTLAEVMVQAVQQVSPAVVTVISENSRMGGTGSGSGVIVSEDGYVITNHHVVDGANDLFVLLSDNTRRDAEFVGSDELSDIAVLRIDGSVPAVATIGNSEQLQPGEPVLAIGSPLGDLRNTVTSGVVSALNRSVAQLVGLIQTDASINRGNSGGPLINLRGEVIGINTLVVRGGVALGGDQAEGLGFAVPSLIFRTVSEQLIQSGEMVYPYVGIRFEMIDAANGDNLPVQNGALVADVEPGTPAEQAGLRPNDIITAIDGVALAQSNSLRFALLQYGPGDTVELTVQRGDEELSLPLTLGTRPDNLELVPQQPRP